MSLDVTFTAYKPLLCPHCGEVVKQEVVDCADYATYYCGKGESCKHLLRKGGTDA